MPSALEDQAEKTMSGSAWGCRWVFSVRNVVANRLVAHPNRLRELGRVFATARARASAVGPHGQLALVWKTPAEVGGTRTTDFHVANVILPYLGEPGRRIVAGQRVIYTSANGGERRRPRDRRGMRDRAHAF